MVLVAQAYSLRVFKDRLKACPTTPPAPILAVTVQCEIFSPAFSK
jgi:hypothetical protein